MGGVVGGGDGDGDDGGGGGGAFLAVCSSNALSNDERNPSSSHDENVSVESPASERVGSSYDGSTVAIHFLSSICFLVCLAQCRKMVPREKENDSPGNCNRTTDILTDKRRIRFILSALLLNRLGALRGGVDRVSFGSLVRTGVLTDRRRIRFVFSVLLEEDDDPLLGVGVFAIESPTTSNVWSAKAFNSICFLVCLAQCRKMVPREKENDSPGNRKRTTDIWSDSRRIRFILSALLLDRLVADFGVVGRVDRADRVLLGGVVDILTDRRRIRFIRSALLLDDDDDLLLGGGVLMFDLWTTSNEWRCSVG